MSSKLNLYLADLAHDYISANFTVPLGIGFIAAYLHELYPDRLDIRLFKSPARLADALNNEPLPDIVGLSNYSWNEGLNHLFEEKLTRMAPGVLLVQGGPHIRTEPDGIEAYLRAHPRVDYYTMFEGEWPMGLLVGEILESGRILRPADLEKPLPGLACIRDGHLEYVPYVSKKGDLSKIPSPYLTGLLDEFITVPEYQPLIETNRGCPFACTFCAWGISALNKVRRFATERVISEIEYIAPRTPSTYWQFTDANFGMFERDIEIAHTLRHAAETSAFNKLSVNWAKNSSKYCTEIARILRGIADPLVAVQSTDTDVLEKIKRSNIKMSTMTDLVEQGRRDGIPMTTDVLSGLSGESLESQLNTLRDVFNMGFDYFNVGPIRMLPGSEMETQESRREYGVVTQFRLISGCYGLYDGKPVVEYEESVVASNAMSREETYTLRLLHFLTWVLWNSGLGQPLLRWMHKAKDVNPLDAILPLLKFRSDPDFEALIDDYMTEARSEWFDSREELIEYWTENFDLLIGEDYVKLNLKYLSRILLNPDLARKLLEIVAGEVGDPIADELVEFSMQRIFFLADRRAHKTMSCSRPLMDALASIYPNAKGARDTVCEFRISPKRLDSFLYELNKYRFDENPERAMALFLQLYGTDMLYDFSFDHVVEHGVSQQATDSFDYEGQLRTKAS